MLVTTIGRVVATFALLIFITIVGVAQTPPAKPQIATYAKSGDLLELTTSVVNKKGNLVSELKRENFQVSIDKEPTEIIEFREEDAPLSVGIIFDASGSFGYSGSMRPVVQSSQKAMKHFLETSNPANEYFLMAFNISPELLHDWTSDSQAIVDSLANIEPKKNTALYDACYLALDKVRHGRYSKRVLILITDGQDNVSTYSKTQVREEIKASDVIIYSLNFSSANLAGIALDSEGQLILEDFSAISGGRFFYQRYGRPVTTGDAITAFDVIAQELRHQYTIAVTHKLPAGDQKWHKIKIKVENPTEKDLSARTRKGFYLNHR